jgi:hypothetical protein
VVDLGYPDRAVPAVWREVMSGAICGKCYKGTNDATIPTCDQDDCPGRAKLTFHMMPRTDTCQHDFRGWRMFDDGRGGERVCTKCGLGAMAHTLSLDI